jgi:hypothetical protein
MTTAVLKYSTGGIGETLQPLFEKRTAKLFLSGVATALLALSAPHQAWAQSSSPQVTKVRTQDNDFSRPVNDPCNGDSVVVNGHETFQFQLQNTGSTHLKIQVHEQGSGVSARNIKYQYQLMNSLFEFESSSSTFSVKFATKNHVIASGGTTRDNFFLTDFSKVVVNNGQGQASHDHSDVGCK